MIKHFFAGITSNVISLVGTVLILVSLLLIAALLIMQGMGFEGGAYLGIITFVVLPMAFLLGLALVPIGLWWRKRKDAKLAAQGKETGHLPDLRPQPGAHPWRAARVRGARSPLARAGRRPDLQGHPLHGLRRVLRHGLPQGHGTGVHGLPALAARAGRLCRLSHRPGRRMVRQSEDLGVLAADRGGLRPVSAPDPDAGALAAPGQRHLRTVSLADQVPRRQAQGPHALRGGRGQHGSQDGADDQGRWQAGGPVAGNPLARRSKPPGPLPR